MVWNKNLPLGTTPIKNSDQMIRDNWDAIEKGLVPNERLRLDEQGGDPANIADTVLIYSKEVDGNTRLFCEEDDGTVVQVTHGKAIPLDEVAADPTNSADRGFIYTKSVSANTELFYEDEAGNVLQLSNAGKIPTQAKIEQTFKTDTYSGSATTLTDVPGLSVTITPTTATSSILILSSVSMSKSSAASRIYFALDKNGADINIGDAASNRTRVTSAAYSEALNQMNSVSIIGFDSPASTAPQTYKIKYQVDSGPLYINRSETDSNSASFGRAVSSIIALEIL